MYQNLPETQEFEEEDTEPFYSHKPMNANVWAKLSYLQTPSQILELRRNKIWFGRDSATSEEYQEFIFNQESFSSQHLERISKCHFIITRDLETQSDSKENPSLIPAVIEVFGRNGIYVNDIKLSMGDKMILSHNDSIKLTKKIALFKFQYESVPAVSTLPNELLAKYFIGHTIGQGGCGVIRLIYNIRKLQKYAMKIIRKENNPMLRNPVEQNSKILNEVKIMRNLHHCHIVQMIDFFETPSNVIIIMEYCTGGDLLHRITNSQPRKKLSEMDAKFFFLQACRGLKYLHDSFVTHRDIKPDNILLSDDSPDPVLKISDFGLSKFIAAASMKTICGTNLYVAPEVLMSTAYTNKVDIWSFGCLLYAMLSGMVPFSENYGSDLNYQIKNAIVKFPSRKWSDVSRTAKDLVLKMLQKDPEKRPTVDDIFFHPWLQCPKTIARINKLYKFDDTLLNSSDETELEVNLVKVKLNDDNEDKSVLQPPQKRRRIN